MDKPISRIVTELESQIPMSESALKDLQSLLDSSLHTNDSGDLDTLYSELSSRNLSISSLVDSLSSAMDNGSDGVTIYNCRISLLASNVYLSLILSPNSPVFTLFTPMSLLSLLRSIRRAIKKASGSSWEGSVVENNRKNKRGSGGRNPRAGKNKGKNLEHGENEREQEENFDARLLFSVLERVEMVLGLVSLDRFPDSLKSLVQTVVEIPVMANEICGDGQSYAKLCDLCVRILGEVLKTEHGDQGVTAAEVLKSMTPLLLLPKSQLRDFALGFVQNRMFEWSHDSVEIKKAIVNLPKFLMHKAPEKAEPRALAVESVVDIVKRLDFEDKVGFVDYIVKMTQGKGRFRLLAVDLIPMLMMQSRDPLGFDLENNTDTSWGLRCLEALIQRCSDVTAGIRAKALSHLAQLVGFLSVDERSKNLLKELMGFANEGLNKLQGGMHHILMTRCRDEKAAVRKAALLMISKLIGAFGGALDGELLKTVGMACSDPLVSIRKAAISALSELSCNCDYRTPLFPGLSNLFSLEVCASLCQRKTLQAFRISCSDNVTTEWLHSVPRLITDNESSIQEECENLFLELVLHRVAKGESSASYLGDLNLNGSKMKEKVSDRHVHDLYPDGVLCILKEICDGEVTPWVKKICSSLGKKKKLKPMIAISLQNIIKKSESLWRRQSMPIKKWTAPPGAWFLLSEVSAFLLKSVDWEFLQHHWTLVDKDKPAAEFKSPVGHKIVDDKVVDGESSSVAWAGDRVFLLHTINNVAVELPPEPAADLAHNLLQRIEKFNMHSTEVNAHVKALITLCRRKSVNPREADSLINKWVDQILSKAAHKLDMYMSSNDTNGRKDSTIFTPPNSAANRGAATPMNRLLLEALSAVYTIGSLVIVSPSADVKAIVPALHTIITSSSSETKRTILPIPVVSVKQVAPSLYIQAWLAMGKICLADGKLAKRYIPLFVQELVNSDCSALRNNIVVMMTDFCVRYTALVDCYMPKVTKCLRDPCELVRRHTFILLARLLQREYVKWRGVLFLWLLLSLVDDSDKIKQLADFLFGNILQVKAPLLAYNSFVEAIYVLNDCNAHTGKSNNQRHKSENSLFSIRGVDENSKSMRMHIYVTLLKQMSPEHLLATFAKVCAEILAAASDGMLDLDDITGQSVLQDAFQVLSSKEIRLPSSRAPSSDGAEFEEDGGEGASASAAMVRGRSITQAVRKGLIQNTVPIFIELKRLLESKNSPLIGSLMECLRILLKDYKNEIDEILIADKQLQKELIYDMQKYETMNAKTAAAEAVASMRRAEVLTSPGDPKHARSGPSKQVRFPENLPSNSKMASAMADAVATARAKSVLREVNWGTPTPPLSAEAVASMRRAEVLTSPGDPKHARSNPSKQVRFPENLPSNSKMASAMADAVATARAKSVLREVNRGTPTPPLSAMNLAKLKSISGGTRTVKAANVLQSLRKRYTFDSDDEN